MADVTPPNWPIYNVRLTDDQISDIIGKVYADGEVVAKTNLGKKKSFNNRIYFVNIKHEDSEYGQPREVVIKVNGRFFGSSKVLNEVSCLLLLQHHCPDVPAPRVLAWSENGIKICAIRNGVYAVLHDEVIESDKIQTAAPSHGWIMTTKLPGHILQRDELTATSSNLVAELADIVASWRTKIPYRKDIGNLTLQSAGYTSSNTLHGLETMAGGLLLCETQPPSPLESDAAYYIHLLSDQMHKIETNKVFASSRSRLLMKLRSFRESVLPYLLPPKQDDESIFTQQDFAPRNILVETLDDGRLHVSGIVDFEFAGLFPRAEDFLTCRVRQKDDWPEEWFETFSSALTKRGVGVPGYDVEKDSFAILSDLAILTEYVAPWWLQDGHITGQELEEQLAETCKIVEDKIEKLSKQMKDQMCP